MEMPDIPDFLLVKNQPPVTHVVAKRERRHKEKLPPFHLPKTMDATAWALLRKMEKAKEEKKKARLAALKAMKKPPGR